MLKERGGVAQMLCMSCLGQVIWRADVDSVCCNRVRDVRVGRVRCVFIVYADIGVYFDVASA